MPQASRSSLRSASDGTDATGAIAISAKDRMLKLVRRHPACLLALRLDNTVRVSDEDIMASLATANRDGLDIGFRERGVPEDLIAEILHLQREVRKDAAAMSESRRLSVWKLSMRFLLSAAAVLVVSALVLFASTLQYTRASCALYAFQNSTCRQGNNCLFQVVVQTGPDFAILAQNWKPPVESWDSLGTTGFEDEGPFKCCNDAGLYVRGASDLLGAGSACCDFWDAVPFLR
ncbi:unnamed protein product [Effrenium voratum]|uniref:Uncharacterized protein n=1 Tax=Effrenium voratum TaxID=2562239 RepID=A0AA36JQI2_9DINO|nr:unnamed protein product [Effrenium voratum]